MENLNGIVGNHNLDIQEWLEIQSQATKNNNDESVIEQCNENLSTIITPRFKHNFMAEETSTNENPIIDDLLVWKRKWKMIKIKVRLTKKKESTVCCD